MQREGAEEADVDEAGGGLVGCGDEVVAEAGQRDGAGGWDEGSFGPRAHLPRLPAHLHRPLHHGHHDRPAHAPAARPQPGPALRLPRPRQAAGRRLHHRRHRHGHPRRLPLLAPAECHCARQGLRRWLGDPHYHDWEYNSDDYGVWIASGGRHQEGIRGSWVMVYTEPETSSS